MPTPLIEAMAIRKQFPGVLALDGVSCAIMPGEVLAIVGENGAGKSTLMKVIAGIYTPDAGELRMNGQPVRFDGPADAMEAGIFLIHQELSLAENLSVLDNLFLGRERTRLGFLRVLDRASMAATGRDVLARVGLPKELLHVEVGALPPGQKQLVEIARALINDAKAIIMDEPTSSLTQKETDTLYSVIDALRSSGVSILYISHRLAEIKRCADRAIVLRDGKLTAELLKDEINHANLVRYMVGRDLKQFFPRDHRKGAGETVLQIRDLRFAGGPGSGISLDVRAGEVLGMAGLVGAGRTELSEAIFGIRAITGGTIQLAGQPVQIRTPRDAIAVGIYLVPEDRKLNGLVVDGSVGENLSLPNFGRISRYSWLSRLGENELHRESIQRLRVKTPSAKQTIGLLSGGNQQKVVFGKWLARGPKLLILDEPTRGVDVGAKAEIYGLIDELAGQGVAIWMITSDLEELLGMSDRAVVMHEGHIAGELKREECNEEAVMRLATGGSE